MAYAALLSKLLPLASYVPSEKNMDLSLTVEGNELDRVFNQCITVAGALDPFKNSEWIQDWERTYGLPIPCFNKEMLYQERIQLLVLAFQERAGISRAWLERMALLLGYPITIREYKPFKAGSVTGEKLTNTDWLYVFTIYTSGKISKRFRTNCSKVGEQLATWGNELLECIIRRYKPAHSAVFFAYLE